MSLMSSVKNRPAQSTLTGALGRPIFRGMSKIGLLFGSFNPVHNGHLAIAKAGLSEAKCNQIWFVLQAHNPFKTQNRVAPLEDRIAMLRLALEGRGGFKMVVSRAPTMVAGLENLNQHYKDSEFVLLMGQDIVESLPSWRDHDKIINKYQVFSYNRLRNNQADVSSENVRAKIAKLEAVDKFVPVGVLSYIKNHHLYRGT